MTVSKEYNKHVYEGNGVTRDWPYDFDLPLSSSGDPDTSLIHVYRTNLRGEVTEVTAFSVDAETGTLTYPVSGSPLETGEKLTILRSLDLTQQFFDPSNQANLYPETLEDNTDRLVMMVQQLQEETDRTVKVSLSTDLETEDTTAEGIFEARDIALSAASASEGYANMLPAIADELDVNIVVDEADLRAKLAAIGESNATLVIATTIPIAADLAIPSNVALSFKKTGQLQPATDKTLTINGPIDAGLWQIFGGNGTVTGTPKCSTIRCEWFGAVGNAITDSTKAIQTACDIAAATDTPVAGGAGEYLVTDTIIINSHGDLGLMTINADGDTVNPVLYVGGDGDTIPLLPRKRLTLPTVVNTTRPNKGWDAASVGIRFGVCYECKFTIPHVTGFHEGVLCKPTGGGFVYNTMHIQRLMDNQRNLVLSAGESDGWVNENTFHDGRLWFTSTATDDWTGTRQIVLERIGNPGSIPNNNLFLKQSIESANVEYGLEINGTYNTFQNLRYEGTGAQRVFLVENNRNLFFGGYGVQNLVYTKSEGITYNLYSQLSGSILRMRGSGVRVGTTSGGVMEFASACMGEAPSSIEESTFSTVNGTLYLRERNSPERNVCINPSARPGSIEMSSGAAGETPRGFCLLGEGVGVYSSLIPRDYSWGYQSFTLGTASHKWDSVYAVNGTIQTSDERAKTEIETIPDTWLDAWGEVEYTRFKLVDAVQKKGDDARWHVGLIAQRVRDVFAARGLNALEIGLLCYDEWEDEYENVLMVDVSEVRGADGSILTPEESHTEQRLVRPAGNLYSIRYDEALALEAAYMRREVQRLKEMQTL